MGVEDATRLCLAQRAAKQQKWDLHQRLPEGPPVSKRLIYRRRQPGHLVGPFVGWRGVPETGARDYRESGAASKTGLRRRRCFWSARVTGDAGGEETLSSPPG